MSTSGLLLAYGQALTYRVHNHQLQVLRWNLVYTVVVTPDVVDEVLKADGTDDLALDLVSPPLGRCGLSLM